MIDHDRMTVDGQIERADGTAAPGRGSVRSAFLMITSPGAAGDPASRAMASTAPRGAGHATVYGFDRMAPHQSDSGGDADERWEAGPDSAPG